MSPFAEGRIDTARARLAECIDELKRATAARESDPMLWFHVGGALEKAKACAHELETALMLEEAAQ